MTIAERQQEIIDEFSIFSDWMEKYEHIIELGKDLRMQMHVGVMRLEAGLEDLAAFDGLAMPALLSEGLRDGLQLERRRRIHVIQISVIDER